MPAVGEFAVAAANPLFARLGRLTCNTNEAESPDRPVFCVEYFSSGAVVVPVELLDELLLPVPLDVLDDPVDDGVPEPLDPVLGVLPLAVVPVELLLELALSLELNGALRKTTERRSVSIRRNKARATCERSISTCPICE